MDGQDRLGYEQRLALELAAIGQRLVTISTEMRQQHSAVATAPPPPVVQAPAPAPVPVPAQEWADEAAAYVQQQPAPRPVAWPPPPQQQPNWQPPPPRESLFDKLGKDGAGSKLLAWVGGAITVLGVVLLLILAVQRGWLGPLPRVIGGAAFSAGLVGIGLWLYRNPHSRTGAFAVAATGFAGLYLDVIAATSIYGYFTEWTGLVVGFAVAAAGVVLALRWDSQTLAVGVVAACAVCAPILTNGFTTLLVGFLLVLKLTSTPVQIQRNWPGLALAGGIPPIIASLVTTAGQVINGRDWAVVGVAAATTVIGVLVALVTVRRRPDDVIAVALVAGSALPALFACTLLNDQQASILAGVVAAGLLAIWMVPDLPKQFTTAAGAAGMLALFQTTVIALDGSVRTAIVLAEAVLLAFLAAKLHRVSALVASIAFGAIGLLMTIGQSVPISWLLTEPRFSRVLPGDYAAGMVTALVLGIFAATVPWAALKMNVLREPGRHPFPWILSGVVLLYGAAGVVLCAALLVSPDETGFLFGHSVVTVSWTIAALFLLVKGIDVVPLRISGLILVGAAVLKLVLFDLAALDGIARVLAFLGAGLVLLTAGARYAKLVASRKIMDSYGSETPAAPS